MGRLLFVRVSAQTYDEKDVPQSWPVLFASVWPDPGVAGVDSPAKLARKLVPEANRGVLELVDAFPEYVRFGDAPEAARKALQPFAEKLEGLRQSLDAALGDRDVKKASDLCNAIEDALDEAEQAARNVK